MPPRKVKRINELNQVICYNCPVVLDDINCEKGKYLCKICKKEQTRLKNLENKKKIVTITHQVCNGECGLNLPVISFEKTPANGFRKTCMVCRKKSRKEKPTTSNEIIKENAKDLSKECIGCNTVKIIVDNFSIHTNNYRNVCTECINKRQYWKIYRTKKRTEDEPAFIARNTLIHSIWVEKNREYYTEYMKQYNKSLSGLLSMYKTENKYDSLKDEFNDINKYTEFITDIISCDCFYCEIKHPEYYNGIDKLDSSVEYCMDNIVPCCSICNFMKNSMDVGSFLRKAREIAIFNKDIIELPQEYCIELKYHSGIELIGNSCKIYYYKNRALKKNLIFELSEKLFNELTQSNCYLCGLSNINDIGIDRKNNDIGYTIENSFPCCSYCNYMKKCHDYNDFLFLIKKITIYSTTDIHQELSNSYQLKDNCT
jgi:hypothetical protein